MSIRSAAAAFGRRNRARKLEFARRFIADHGVRSVLLVGVYPHSQPDTNQVERGIQEAVADTVATGILATERPDWRSYIVADGRALPFADDSFDLVYSNAVIEHVGGEKDQRRFVAEHARVGRSWILTTPNRLFPVEAHFHTVFLHSRRGWAREDVTRLLSRGDLRALIPSGARIVGSHLHPTLTAYRSPQ